MYNIERLIELGKKYLNDKNVNNDLKELLLDSLMDDYNLSGQLVYSEDLYDVLGIDKKFWVLDDMIKVGYEINKIAGLNPLQNLNHKNYRLFANLSAIAEYMLVIPVQYATYKRYGLYDSNYNVTSTLVRLIDKISNSADDADVYMRVLRVEMQYLIDTYGTIEIDLSDKYANKLDMNKLVPKEYMESDRKYLNNNLMNIIENLVSTCHKNIEVNGIMRNVRDALDVSSADSVDEIKGRIDDKSLDIDKTIELLKELQAKLKTL